MWALLQLLIKVSDHLLGVQRPNFQRLFMATCKGESCPELDRFKVAPAPCTQEVTDKENGYWLPMWTWPIVRVLFTAAHQQDVAAGKAKPMSNNLLPETRERVQALSNLLVMMSQKLSPGDSKPKKGESDADRPSTAGRRVHEEGVPGVAYPADHPLP